MKKIKPTYWIWESFEPTYEELKQARLGEELLPALRFEPTYEELKQFFWLQSHKLSF